MLSKTTIVQGSLAAVLVCAIVILSSVWATKPPYRESQAANCPSCDITSPIGSPLQRIEKAEVDGRDGYAFQCAGWEYSVIKRPADELWIRFDPNQKEPSPRCLISKSPTGQRITTLYLEFLDNGQLRNMLFLSPIPPR